MPPRVVSFLNRWRVRAGLPCVLLTLVLAEPNYYSLLSGLGFFILGMLLRAWSSGHLTKNTELTTSGPYRYTRNPLYLGNMLMGLGVVAAGRSLWVLALISLYFFLFYPAIILKEREKMRELYPESYRQYSSRIPALLPTWKAYPLAPPRVFRWELYRKNKEYRAIQASLVFWGLMLLKIVVF